MADLLSESVAWSKRDLLPPGRAGFPELEEARTEQHRLLDAIHDAQTERAAVIRAHDAEDVAADRARVDAVRRGRAPKLPKRTSPEARAAALADADAAIAAAQQVYAEWADDTLADIQRLAPEWAEQLAERRAAAADKRAEAERLLREADAIVVGVERLSRWLDRITHGQPFQHVPWSDFPAPTPPPAPDMSTFVGGFSEVQSV